MIQEECFAYINENKCSALIDMICKNERCKFYKNKSEVNLARREEAMKKYAMKHTKEV